MAKERALGKMPTILQYYQKIIMTIIGKMMIKMIEIYKGKMKKLMKSQKNKFIKMGKIKKEGLEQQKVIKKVLVMMKWIKMMLTLKTIIKEIENLVIILFILIKIRWWW